jgi:hypothetical protein
MQNAKRQTRRGTERGQLLTHVKDGDGGYVLLCFLQFMYIYSMYSPNIGGLEMWTFFAKTFHGN